MSLAPLPSISEIRRRLGIVLPEGVSQRQYCTRELAASTVFAMLYVGAVSNENEWFAPKQVCRMSDAQAASRADEARRRYARNSMTPGFRPKGRAWYADNTREPIRDETLRAGLVALGAVVTRANVPTTSSVGRYALHREFAALFDPRLRGKAFAAAATRWQERNLNPHALARVRLLRSAAATGHDKVAVCLPNGETRLMEPGPSSILTKSLLEEFAPRFLEKPAVVWVSESGRKVVARYDDLAKAIGIRIDVSGTLPDAILADLAGRKPLLVFAEVVATDGAITEGRRTELMALAEKAGFSQKDIAFVTVFLDREDAAARRAYPNLAWGSFAWYSSEPEHVALLTDEGRTERARLRNLIA